MSGFDHLRRFTMWEICCGATAEGEPPPTVPAVRVCEKGSQRTRRGWMDVRMFGFAAGMSPDEQELDPKAGRKRRKLDDSSSSSSSATAAAAAAASPPFPKDVEEQAPTAADPSMSSAASGSEVLAATTAAATRPLKYGLTSVCGMRRDMEDAVSIQSFFSREQPQAPQDVHFFGVFDGHGCSHVSFRCKDLLHGLVAEELGRGEVGWPEAMERSFSRMDRLVTDPGVGGDDAQAPERCRCELQQPQSDAVGSTAVVAVVSPTEIVVANCGDSRAVLCRGDRALPLSSDHKPDRPDELLRIEEAGGRVIYWDGARVLGVLAMSRAIGDSYLKPYVISTPEVTVTERSEEDVCMILASDGLWDVVSNETACDVARTCLTRAAPSGGGEAGPSDADNACRDASMLLTKLALARRSTDNVSVVVVDLRRDL